MEGQLSTQKILFKSTIWRNRVSTSASSKVKSGESTCSSRNKNKFVSNTTDYVQLINQKSMGSPAVNVFYHPTNQRGNSSKGPRDG